MVQKDNSRQYRLSAADREHFRWNQTTSRRQSVPDYPNSLAIADKRMRKCKTCGKCFSSIGDMKRHVSLTHTGTKPVVCQICEKRFGSTSQMIAHYQMHREARLQEFSILTKRRQNDIVSEPSDPSNTTAGSFRIPKTLKSHVSEPNDFNKSFGTRQSFCVEKGDEGTTRTIGVHSYVEKSNKLPDIRGATKSSSRTRENLSTVAESISLPKLSAVNTHTIPVPDPGHISAIENVMGVSRAIETSDESHFRENAEAELIRSRMDAVSRAGRSPTPKSFRTMSGLTEYRKPKYLVDKEFWDAGSQVTDRLTGYSPVSGYDPYIKYVPDSRGRQRKSAYSFPDIRKRN